MKKAKASIKTKVSIMENKELTLLDFPNILWLNAYGDITYVWVVDKNSIVPRGRRRITSYHHLKHFEDLLPKDKFIRTCKSCIVNFDRIKSIGADSLIIEGMEDEPVTLSPLYRLDIIDRLLKL
jgi:DNA-binding LytR/AlgR family response regulator